MSGIRIAVLISGGGSNLQALIDEIARGNICGQIDIVISNRAEAYGLERASRHGIENKSMLARDYGTAKERDLALLALLKERKIDLVVLAGYLAILPDIIIEEFRNKIINIHPSLIPSFAGDGFYGERVHRAALERGVKLSGATVHFVDEVTDGGPIILQRAVNVDFHDDVESLQKKILNIEHEILPLAVRLFAEGRVEVIGNRVKIYEKEVK